MKIGIGIDTGGTYTDAVAYDFEAGKVLAKGKALTTKQNLTIGIGEAIDSLPKEQVEAATIVALSTTLATNACVEGKGGRAKLILIGASERLLDWIGADEKYGLEKENILCIDIDKEALGEDETASKIDEALEAAHEWLADADALSIAEVDSMRNGAAGEKRAKEKLESLGVPIICASGLVRELNVMERGATALLNARLLPVIKEFLGAVKSALEERGIEAPAMIVRSDGSLMTEKLSQKRPVETVHSGPAASVLGARGLTSEHNCIIVDMGGTTTDVSIIRDGAPSMNSSGISIGGWRTQVKGVFMQTVALGGDSVIRLKDGRLDIGSRRAQPLCVAAQKWPKIKDDLKVLLYKEKKHTYPLHEFLYLEREPSAKERYSQTEQRLIEALKTNPMILESAAKAVGTDVYGLDSERLENEGIVMRCGLTPTDIMHIKGDFESYDEQASRLAAKYFISCMYEYSDDEKGIQAFGDKIYDLIKHKLYANIVDVLMTEKHPELSKEEPGDRVRFLISQSWKEKQNGDEEFFEFGFKTSAALVGIGAPTHVFLPDVAKALGAECTIPKHAEVANAVGAVIADISAKAKVEVSPIYSPDGVSGYTVYTDSAKLEFAELEEALAAAETEAKTLAKKEARARGALGELDIKTKKTSKEGLSNHGNAIDLGTTVQATATGRIGL